MNTELQNQFIAAIQQIQKLSGETVTLAATDYNCTAATTITNNLEWVYGGAIEKAAVTVSVLQSDLPTEPAVDTLGIFRGQNMRVLHVEDAITLWQITLVQQAA